MKVQQISLSVLDTQILKGVAVLLLLFHHLFMEGTGFDDVYIGQIPLIQTFGQNAKLCVAIFVFLSGYGLMSGAIKTNGIHHLLAFYRKRYVKLMVNFWLIWLLFVPLGVFVFNRTFPEVYGEHYVIRIFSDLLGICSTSSYNPTWWFYGCIICLYFLFPFLYKIIDYWYLLIPLSAILVFASGISMPGFDLFRSYLCVFILGMTIRKYPIIIAKAPTVLLLFSIIVLFVCRMWVPFSFTIVWDTVVTCVGAFVYVQIRLSRWLTQSLSFMGKHSFNIFLFHTFFLLYMHHYIYWSKNPILIFLTMLLTSIVVSVVIEKIRMLFGINKFQQLLIGNN